MNTFSRIGLLAVFSAVLAAGRLSAAEPEPTVIPDGQPETPPPFRPMPPNPLRPDGVPHIVMPMDREALLRWQQQVTARIQQQMAEARQRAGQMPGQPARQVRMEKAPFLGLSTAPVPQKIREELKIAPNQGVQVEFVEPGSPAAEAGIKPKDILTKLGDQKLINAQQLAVLVREHKPGDTVTLSGFQNGKPATFAGKLVEKEVPVLEDTSPWLTGDAAQANPLELDAPDLPLPPGLILPPGALPGGVGPWQHNNLLIGPNGQMTQSYSDGETNITVTTKGNDKHLLAKDRDGKVLFDGPINTDKERQELPADIAAKLDKLERTTRVHIMPGRPGAAPRNILPENPPDLEQPNPPAENSRVETRTTHQSMSLASSDKQHTLQLTITGQGDAAQKRAVIKDRAGTVLFDGPLNTPEERAKVPADLLPKLEALEKKAGN